MDLNRFNPGSSRFGGNFAEMGSRAFDPSPNQDATMEGSVQCAKRSDSGKIQGTSELSVQTDFSAVTEANSGNFTRPEDSANQGLKMADHTSTEWTDEKHSSHLDSMEASFVKQLYDKECHSMYLNHWLSRRQKLLDRNSTQSDANNPFSFSQFKVLQRGCLQKINFDSARSRLDTRNESQVLLANPWIQHYRPASTGTRVEATLSYPLVNSNLVSEGTHLCVPTYGEATRGPATHSKQSSACFIHMNLQESVLGNAEMSDQNFRDDDCDEGDNSSNPCSKKRMRITAVDASNKDQL